jgi:hypothetical protein
MPDANLSKADASRFSYLVGIGLLYKQDHIDIMIFVIIVTFFYFKIKNTEVKVESLVCGISLIGRDSFFEALLSSYLIHD